MTNIMDDYNKNTNDSSSSIKTMAPISSLVNNPTDYVDNQENPYYRKNNYFPIPHQLII